MPITSIPTPLVSVSLSGLWLAAALFATPAVGTEATQTVRTETPAPSQRTVYPQWFGCCGKFSYGFIDVRGHTVIEPKYSHAFYFQGHYVIEKDTKAGAMDINGHVLFEPKYDDIHNVSDQTAVVKLNGKYVLIDRTEHVLSSPEIDYVGGSLNPLLFIVKIGKKQGLIDNSGRTVVEAKYDDIGFLNEGLATVKIHDKWGVINSAGQDIVEPKYDKIYDFHERRAAVELQGKWGVIDDHGQEIVTPAYDSVWNFRNGLANFTANGKSGFIDPTGKVVIEPRFDWADIFSEGLARVMLDHKVGFIDTSGRMTIESQFDHAWPFSDGLAMVKVDRRYGFIDKSGHFAIEPIFTNANSFTEGLAGVEIGYSGKYGFIDPTGRMVIEPQFPSSPDPFMGGFIKVMPNRCIDRSGRAILDLFDPVVDWCDFQDGVLKLAKLDDRLAASIDRQGTVVAHVEKRCGQTALIDAAGGVSWPPDMDQVCRQYAKDTERLHAASGGNYVCVRKWTSAGGYCGHVVTASNDDVWLRIERVDINGGPYFTKLEGNECSDNRPIGEDSKDSYIRTKLSCLTGTR